MTLGIRMTGDRQEELYYLTIPKGDRAFPTTKAFDVAVDDYTMLVYYVEFYDPVYGFQCNSPVPSQTTINKNMQWSFLECGHQPANLGENSIRKFWPYRIFKFHFVIPPVFVYRY